MELEYTNFNAEIFTTRDLNLEKLSFSENCEN